MANVLDEIANLGEDALQNHYSIILPTTIAQFAGVVDPLTMRITNVNLPDKTIGSTYTITKRGRKFDRPSGIIDTSKEVSFSFRPDKKLFTYKAMTNWLSYIQNSESGFMASDSGADGTGGPSLYRANIEVWAIDDLMDSIGVPNSIWILEGAFPTSVGALEFSEESGDPFDVSVTLNCRNVVFPI